MAYTLTTATKKVSQMKARIRAVQGGTSASKTISILLVLIDRAQTKQKAKELTSIVSESIPHLKRGAIRDFKNIMQTHNYWSEDCWNATDSIYTFETGNQIEFFSSDNGDKLRGARRDWLFINEANNVPFEAFEQLEVRTKKGVYLDWNPTNEFWFYTDVKDRRDDVEHIVLTYKDNEALSEEIIKSIEQRKNRPGWWKVYGEGQLGEVDGKIYKNWNILDTIPIEARLKRRGLDFGYTNDPSAIVDVYEYNGGYVIDEIAYQNALSNKELSDIIKLQPEQCIVVADSAEPKSIDEIRAYGITIIPAKKGPGSLLQGIQLVQDKPIWVTKRSANILKEYRNYLWMTDKNGKVINEPEGGFDHAMDAIRYAIGSINVVQRKQNMVYYPSTHIKRTILSDIQR